MVGFGESATMNEASLQYGRIMKSFIENKVNYVSEYENQSFGIVIGTQPLIMQRGRIN